MSAKPSDAQVTVVPTEENPVAAYERPLLVAVGNLHDLLAQGGTQNTDPGNVCITPGATFTSGCQN